jgi:hypothetical protein
MYESSISDAPLKAIHAEWKRQDVDYFSRIDHLTHRNSGGLNGATVLTASNVYDDGAADVAFGELGRDWFLVHDGDLVDTDWIDGDDEERVG